MKWEHRVLTTGLSGKSLYFIFSYVDLHLCKWKDTYETVGFVILYKDLTCFGECSGK